MDLIFTDEQTALRDAVNGLLMSTHPLERVSALADGTRGWDPAIWKHLAQMGLLGLSVPEALGGSGAGLVEEVVLFEQAGASLLPGPLFPTVALALPALLASPLAAETVPAVVSGERRASFAWIEDGQAPYLARAAMSALQAELDEPTGTAVLRGSKTWVMDAASVDWLVVAGRTARGAGLFLVETADSSVSLKAAEGIDGTRRLFQVTFDGTQGRSLVDPAQSRPVFAAVWRRGLLLAAAEAVGIGSRLVGLSADHARTREQFGRPIGTYQAVSHAIADMYMNVELARSLCIWGALEAEAGSRTVDLAVAAAASVALPGAVAAAERALQVHGGLGMTWESPIHRFLKRSLQLATLDAPPELQRHQIARVLLDS
jgi:alkylation response protein AidB-like acyl-CoA dehydrogenase